MHVRVFLLLGLGVMAIQPMLSKADEAKLVVDWSLVPGSSHHGVHVTVQNPSATEVQVQHPANRGAVAFVVLDRRGNVVQPVGVAKVDPRNVNLKLNPGETFQYSLDQNCRLAHSKGFVLPFLTGTGLFAYDLRQGPGYRVTMIYRPNGLKGHGIASREREWTGEHHEGAATTPHSVAVHLGGPRDREAWFQFCYRSFLAMRQSGDYYRFSKAAKEGVPKEKWFRNCYEELIAIKPGITRRELTQIVDTDGGLSMLSCPRYVHPDCHCLKVDVGFDVKRDPGNQNRVIVSGDDTVRGVSRPYVETPFCD